MPAVPPDIETGLAELSGTRVCARPGCDRIHGAGMGKRTLVAGVKILTCFGPCASWAADRADKEKRS